MRFGRYEVPDILGNIREIAIFWRVMLAEVAKLEAAFALAEREIHADTAESFGLDRWEQIYQMTQTNGYSTQERRARLAAWMEEIAEYSLPQIEAFIRRNGGADSEILLQRENGRAVLLVRLALTSMNNTQDMIRRLRELLPAGVLLEVEVLYRSFASYDGTTFDDHAALTWAQLREVTT